MAGAGVVVMKTEEEGHSYNNKGETSAELRPFGNVNLNSNAVNLFADCLRFSTTDGFVLYIQPPATWII